MYEKVKQYNHQPLIGNDQFMVIAGPCAVENEENLILSAQFLLENGIHYMRAGAYKPRTSPYTFQGLEEKGLKILKKVKNITGIKVVSEIVDINQIPDYEANIDIIQVGARNMQNFTLLKALGKINKPILLKRGFGSTITEWLYACEYLLNEGNQQVILCERGIKTFETMTRNTLDISSIPIVKGLTKIPVLIDPSHSSGRSDLIIPLSKASVAVGADGLLIEVHNDPNIALSDKDETIDFSSFVELIKQIKLLTDLYQKEII